MDTTCSHCTQLIESSIVAEPHDQLTVVQSKSDATVYRCRLCHTMFEFTSDSIYLLVSNPQSQQTSESRCA